MNETDHAHGIRFACTQCSMCCRFDSGYVFLSRADLTRLEHGLTLTGDQVIDRYCRVVNLGGFRQISLRERENNDCIFWADGGCTIYDYRPLQCRSYPFWAHQVADAESWRNVAAECPGVGVGRVHSHAEIEEWLAMRRLEPPVSADALGADER